MDVGILHSGGKDSTFAIDWAKENGHTIKWLLSVKPTRTDCFLYHYATVEHTPLMADLLCIPHKLITCDVADPILEANLARDAIKTLERVDAVLLGGTGLQETQIRSLKNALAPLGIDVFPAHRGHVHANVMRHMLSKGYRFIITQVAADGLGAGDLGRELTLDNLDAFFARADKYGFHNGGEGGVYDTLCIDGPLFSKALVPTVTKITMESQCSGHLACDIAIVPKIHVTQ